MTNTLNKKTKKELMELLDEKGIDYKKNDLKAVLVEKLDTFNGEETTSETSTVQDGNVIERTNEKATPEKNIALETSDKTDDSKQKGVFGDYLESEDLFPSREQKNSDKNQKSIDDKQQLFHHNEQTTSPESSDNKQVVSEKKAEDTETSESLSRKERYKAIAEEAAKTVDSGKEILDKTVQDTSSSLQKFIDKTSERIQEEDQYLNDTSVLMTKKEYYINLGFSFAFGMLFFVILKYLL